ncbi:Tyrosine-protein phosphatase non-receptor type 13 [Varanus komodoensis]|nr:Tyrosine-protein phosphatase non-receptor type 13 [Varanus komodoensis]
MQRDGAASVHYGGDYVRWENTSPLCLLDLRQRAREQDDTDVSHHSHYRLGQSERLITAERDCSQEIKMLAPGEESYGKSRQHTKKQRHYPANKSAYSPGYGFPSCSVCCESWTIRKAERRRIEAFELWCWRRLLRVPWTARRSNRSGLEINSDCSIEGQILKMKLKYFGHLMRRKDSLEKSLMLGTTEGKRRRGRQKMGWLDGVTEAVSMSLSGLWGMMEDRKAWRNVVHGVAMDNMHVSLAEALEVRGGPLHEEELWAILNQSAESLQELFQKADPTALGFIISPWSLLLLPSGSVSFTDENISNQDLRAFTAPEVLQNQSLASLSDVEKVQQLASVVCVVFSGCF